MCWQAYAHVMEGGVAEPLPIAGETGDGVPEIEGDAAEIGCCAAKLKSNVATKVPGATNAAQPSSSQPHAEWSEHVKETLHCAHNNRGLLLLAF